MKDRERKILHEAFTAGWQAALAVRIKDPRVLAVVQSCFEQWLEEEVDEVSILGLSLRRRHDLPRPVVHSPAPRNGTPVPRGRTQLNDEAGLEDAHEEATAYELVAADLRSLVNKVGHPRREARSNGRVDA